jgi:hypothetical protein
VRVEAATFFVNRGKVYIGLWIPPPGAFFFVHDNKKYINPT